MVRTTWRMSKQKQTVEWNIDNHIQKYYKPLKKPCAQMWLMKKPIGTTLSGSFIAPVYQLVDDQPIEKWTNHAKQGGHLKLSCCSGIPKTASTALFECHLAGKITDRAKWISSDLFSKIPS